MNISFVLGFDSLIEIGEKTLYFPHSYDTTNFSIRKSKKTVTYSSLTGGFCCITLLMSSLFLKNLSNLILFHGLTAVL